MTLRQTALKSTPGASLPKQECVTDASRWKSGRFDQKSPQRPDRTPKAYRQGGAGAEIRFAVGKCSLGSILVAATDLGVCAIQMGDDSAALVRALEDRFPARSCGPAMPRWTKRSPASSASSSRRGKGSTCRWTSAARPSNSVFGRRCARSRSARPSPMPNWPLVSASPRHSGQSLKRVAPIRWPW